MTCRSIAFFSRLIGRTALLGFFAVYFVRAILFAMVMYIIDVDK